MSFKERDFVELDYTGKIKETGDVFDTTKADVAHDHHAGHTHEPAIICIGQGQILRGIDEFLIGKSPGTYTLELAPDKAFGKRNAELIQLIQTRKFLEQKIQPIPGGRVNIDGSVGVVRTVSGGRTIVDFNHPLAGRELSYELEAKRVVDAKDEQIKSLLKMSMGLRSVDVAIAPDGKTGTVTFSSDMPEAFGTALAKMVRELCHVDVTVASKKKEQKDTSETVDKKASVPPQKKIAAKN